MTSVALDRLSGRNARAIRAAVLVRVISAPHSAKAAGTPSSATLSNRSPHTSGVPNDAPHSRIALSSTASNTGARLPGEALITCNTSAVAVCCSSASRCSVMQPRVLHRDHRLGGEVLQ